VVPAQRSQVLDNSTLWAPNTILFAFTAGSPHTSRRDEMQLVLHQGLFLRALEIQWAARRACIRELRGAEALKPVFLPKSATRASRYLVRRTSSALALIFSHWAFLAVSEANCRASLSECFLG